MVYVDDYLAASNSTDWSDAFAIEFARDFELNNLGDVSKFISIGVTLRHDGYHLEQVLFIDKMFSTFFPDGDNFLSCLPIRKEDCLLLPDSEASPTLPFLPTDG